eukprot:10847167-Ditylum_brightwellii.AAC.1
MGVTRKYDDANDDFVSGYQPSPPRTNEGRSDVDNTPIVSPIEDPRYARCTNASKTRSPPSRSWGRGPKPKTRTSCGRTCQ